MYKMQTKPIPVRTIFRALSDQTRLRILNLLRGGEVCVCHLVAVLGVPQPTASRHLSYLRKAGLVVARKDGLWNYYRLSPACGKSHKMLLACLVQCFQEDAAFAEDGVKLRARIQAGYSE
jgi:ArsR family transcriptional regulator, arsenate/arsenite/antimonite-responsive transcriptional repressor